MISNGGSPLFTVVIPAYESHATIGRAVRSALENQTPLEVVVVDDGSSRPLGWGDLPHGPVRLIRMSRNSGTAIARNTGIRNARGRFIAFLDADDEYEPERLDRLRNSVEETALDGVVTDTLVLSTDGSSRVASSTPNSEGMMHLRTSCVFGAHVLDRSVFDRLGYFDPRWRIQEDADMWLRLILSGACIRYVPRPRYIYRLNDAGKTLGKRAVVGLHEFRNIHLVNAFRPGVSMKNRALLIGRAGKWERRALPHHIEEATRRIGRER